MEKSILNHYAISICVAAILVAGCGGSEPTVSEQVAARPAMFSGNWGVEYYGQGGGAADGSGSYSFSFCSPKGLGCTSASLERVKSLTLPGNLSGGTSGSGASASSSVGGVVALGSVSVDGSATFGGLTLTDSGASAVVEGTLYWIDEFEVQPIKKVSSATLTAKVQLTFKDTGAVECPQPSNAGVSVGTALSATIDTPASSTLQFSYSCLSGKWAPSGTIITTVHFTVPKNQFHVPQQIQAFTEFTVSTAGSYPTISWTSHLHNPKVKFTLNTPDTVTYTTASGVCYKTQGTCP